jgi:DNA-binding XRE family transcriptional regulator
MGIKKATNSRHKKRAKHKGRHKRENNPSPKFTLKQKARQTLQYRTQKQAAKILGVSDRTIRRWLSGETKTPLKLNQKHLNTKSRDARRRSYRHGSPKEVPVPPPIKRIGTQNYAKTTRLIPSDIRAYVHAQARTGVWMRFVVKVPKSPDYLAGYMSLDWNNLEYLTPPGIDRAIDRALQHGEIVQAISGYPKVVTGE